ncbi:MAG: DUF1073 domain-containing protein [Deltaproteobacteria bacterium]|jgi:phage-related protein (TIGR01555 family)|nr:DUF1073 domain-containing protein [Deltaproteobacteria bacterium]
MARHRKRFRVAVPAAPVPRPGIATRIPDSEPFAAAFLPDFGLPRTLGNLPQEIRTATDSFFNGMAQDSGASLASHRSFGGHALSMGIDSRGGYFYGYHQLGSLAQNGLVRACVSTPINDMFRNWTELRRTGKAVKGEDPCLEALNAEFERFRVKKCLQDAAETAGYFGGCFLFIDTGARGAVLAEPLYLSRGSAGLPPGSLRRFVLVEPLNASPEVVNFSRPIDEDYLRPEWWHVQNDRIHRTRLIRISGPLPPQALLAQYNFLGIPQAQLIADYVLHFQADRLQASGLLKNVASKVFKTNMRDVLFSGTGVAEFQNRLRLLGSAQDNSGILALDKEEEDFIKVETNLGGVTDIVRQALELVCAVNRTPVTKTLGVSPAGFNATGESDLRNYYDRVAALQEEQLAPALETMLRVLQLNLNGDVDPSVVCRFKPLSEDDRKLRAEIRKLIADTDAIYLDRGVVLPEEARDNIIDDPDSGYDDEGRDDLGEAGGRPANPGGGMAGMFGGGYA